MRQLQINLGYCEMQGVLLQSLHGHQISIKEVWFPERYRTGVRRQTPGCIPLDTQWRDPAAEGVAVQGWAG